jgi:hypothetical protein
MKITKQAHRRTQSDGFLISSDDYRIISRRKIPVKNRKIVGRFMPNLLDDSNTNPT